MLSGCLAYYFFCVEQGRGELKREGISVYACCGLLKRNNPLHITLNIIEAITSLAHHQSRFCVTLIVLKIQNCLGAWHSKKALKKRVRGCISFPVLLLLCIKALLAPLTQLNKYF